MGNLPIKPPVVNKAFTTSAQLNRQTRAAMWSRTLVSATTPHRIMKKVKNTLVLGLLISLAGGITAARADEKPGTKPAATPAKQPAQPIQQTLAGKVVAVDKAAKTVTMQINSQTYVLQLTSSSKITKAGQTKSIFDVNVGEDISVEVLLKENTQGKVEVVVLSVQLSDTAEAQGKGGNGKGGANRPFQTVPNPANVDGPVVSPNKGKK
jgi:hypothetical protein